MPRYLLAPNSYACETGGHAVFLDLKHDKYTAVSPEDLTALRAAVEGWKASPAAAVFQTLTPAPSSDSSRSQEEEDVIQTLLKEGLLTDRADGKPATPLVLAEPTMSLWEFPRPWPQLQTRDLWNFVSAWATTTIELRMLPIRYVVNRLRNEKILRRRQRATFDIDKARLLTTIHFTLQPAFYSVTDACLRDSLTLMEFLGKYGIHPVCVFGVKMNPFAAHAWLQHGAVVLTDPIEYVKTFTPIMLV